MPAYYLQTLTPKTAQPVLMDQDSVAGCVNRHGKGSAYLIGTLLGHGLLSYNHQGNADFLAQVLNLAGVVPDRVGTLKRRRRVQGAKTAWFLFNVTDAEVMGEFSTAGFRTVADLLGEDVVRNGSMATVRVPSMDIRCIVLES